MPIINKKKLVVKGRESPRNSIESVSSIIRLDTKPMILDKKLNKQT
jgi:hypothetical protein